MDCNYTLLKSNSENQTYFGIRATDDKNQTVAEIYNVSADGEKVERLVRLCNKLKLSSIHIFDVIDDLIG